MKPDDKRSGAQKDAEPRADAEAVSAAIEAQAASLERSEAMLRVLSRDETLRTSYVRRRWQRLTR
jgi:hypothetical protein